MLSTHLASSIISTETNACLLKLSELQIDQQRGQLGSKKSPLIVPWYGLAQAFLSTKRMMWINWINIKCVPLTRTWPEVLRFPTRTLGALQNPGLPGATSGIGWSKKTSPSKREENGNKLRFVTPEDFGSTSTYYHLLSLTITTTTTTTTTTTYGNSHRHWEASGAGSNSWDRTDPRFNSFNGQWLTPVAPCSKMFKKHG